MSYSSYTFAEPASVLIASSLHSQDEQQINHLRRKQKDCF